MERELGLVPKRGGRALTVRCDLLKRCLQSSLIIRLSQLSKLEYALQYVTCLFPACLNLLIYYELYKANTKSKNFKEVREQSNSNFYYFLLALWWTILQTLLHVPPTQTLPSETRCVPFLQKLGALSDMPMNSTPAEIWSRDFGSRCLWPSLSAPSLPSSGARSWAESHLCPAKAPHCSRGQGTEACWQKSDHILPLPWKHGSQGLFSSTGNAVNSNKTALPVLRPHL